MITLCTPAGTTGQIARLPGPGVQALRRAGAAA